MPVTIAIRLTLAVAGLVVCALVLKQQQTAVGALRAKKQAIKNAQVILRQDAANQSVAKTIIAPMLEDDSVVENRARREAQIASSRLSHDERVELLRAAGFTSLSADADRVAVGLATETLLLSQSEFGAKASRAFWMGRIASHFVKAA